MKPTGVVRPIDKLGRLAIPFRLRAAFNISTKDSVDIYTEEDKIVLQKYLPGCVFCGKKDNLVSFSGKNLCTECVKKLKAMK